jgi:hypothetical protein
MKHLYTLLAACVLTLVTTAQGPELTISKFASAPVIDGTVDAAWDLISQIYPEMEPDDNPAPVSFIDAWFKMGWTDDGIYLLVMRDDDDFATQWVTGLADWQSDRDEIYFDVNIDTLNDGRGASDAQVGGTGADFGHYQFTSIWAANGTADGVEPQWTGSPTQWYHNAPYELGYSVDGDMYYAEYYFPFTSLTINTELLPDADESFQASEGAIFGFELILSDVDMGDDPVDETARKFLKWAGANGWNTLDTAATITLGSDVISGLELHTANSVTLYPSPASGFVSLNGLQSTASIQVIDLVGNVVLEQLNVSAGTQIEIRSLVSGVYFMRINNEETIKFVVQ